MPCSTCLIWVFSRLSSSPFVWSRAIIWGITADIHLALGAVIIKSSQYLMNPNGRLYEVANTLGLPLFLPCLFKTRLPFLSFL